MPLALGISSNYFNRSFSNYPTASRPYIAFCSAIKECLQSVEILPKILRRGWSQVASQFAEFKVKVVADCIHIIVSLKVEGIVVIVSGI